MYLLFGGWDLVYGTIGFPFCTVVPNGHLYHLVVQDHFLVKQFPA
jgi:hypothetical protein